MAAVGYVVVLAVLTACSATNENNLVYPSTHDGTLTCHVSDPFLGVRPETPQLLPLSYRRFYTDDLFTGGLDGDGNRENVRYQVLLPPTMRFEKAVNAPHDMDILINFLGDDFDQRLTSITEPPPGRPAPRACDLLPSIFGSAGQATRHVETPNETLSLLELPTLPMGSNPLFEEVRRDRGFADRNFAGSQFADVLAVIRDINSREELCDLWVGRCPLRSRWVKLPEGYFPQYIAQSVCSGKNCSLPRGLRCHEDLRYTVSVTVLRYDCCYNHEGREVLWECGWRKVRIPIFCDCQCGCDIVSPHD